MKKTVFTIFFIFYNQYVYSQQSFKVDIRNIPQNTSYWCWAACIEMAVKYYDRNSKVDQCKIVSEKYNKACDCSKNTKSFGNKCRYSRYDSTKCGGRLDDNLIQDGSITDLNQFIINNLKYRAQKIDSILNEYGLKNNKIIESKNGYYSLKTAILEKKVIIGILDSHYVIIKGFEEKNNSKFLIIYDPYRVEYFKKNKSGYRCKSFEHKIDLESKEPEDIDLKKDNLKSNFKFYYNFNYYIIASK